ncbi:MAG: methylenetetrahydrofolate reductase [Eubacteriales bacterium]|nr:methylenetetrahydrofolate reductase [Eubacteriales bacterium]
MSLLKKLTEQQSAFSLEFFPPKKDMPISSVYGAVEKLSAYNPAFVSVTYGAGGSNRDRTIDIASHIKNSFGLDAIAHLTCVGADPVSINGVLAALEQNGISNVLALRGDIPDGMDKATAFTHYQHASDLIKDIKKRGGYTIAAAAYPEGHVESASLDQDIEFMRLKEASGTDFFITQLCFDKTAITRFFEKLTKAGIKAPVVTGIMPVLNPNQIIRMALLSACSIPASLSKIICRFGDNDDDFRKAGVAYAVEEIDYLLANGIHNFHLYTMNKSEAVEQIILDSDLNG